MKLLIDCDQHLLGAAFELLTDEAKRIEKYDRVGWGWVFHAAGASFFVRRTKHGLSIAQRGERQEGSADRDGATTRHMLSAQAEPLPPPPSEGEKP